MNLAPRKFTIRKLIDFKVYFNRTLSLLKPLSIIQNTVFFSTVLPKKIKNILMVKKQQQKKRICQ
ncbi:hypothetical protein DEX24_00220 [Kurthia sibirica]|uniref:Uncharacterized protein n=1 Tax=Kurthia sibirica TaxID=202750 RepID=A0A2U3AQD9_9BACL|nr:hypothetical protein DEX24_00220 [Kurthia sibirica]